VLIIVPGLVLAVGIVVLLLGRKATRDSAETMARHQLVAQAPRSSTTSRSRSISPTRCSRA